MLSNYSKRKKKAQEISLISCVRFGKYPGKNKVTIIVDVDDKNCLAQITAVLKLNHGVRQ